MSAVISVRVKKEVKEELERKGVNINKLLKEYLEEVYIRVKAKEHVEKWNRLLSEAKPSAEGFASRSVREDREGH
ncbi:VapB-type antitoxin [Candidatus Marsarchaeota G2 archaeon OSP_D]|jgi:hypothetical protein|uniref:VapB-type antitoxin n=3 Tax=Candidatus Marsarchaeota TaxID=1978152 RepID=A0A2R6C0H1_9ARCH|nr:MAG: VapB-type antitoxin [Candidatus Marsarchaeota G2 archaeon OSP_D]PSN85123.1 MAG: VapB-type antitoxin [Candidatus Marsarchaeota G1 archaeon OSP_C]PSO04388.1 MAG: VapB-type antitoxin [Candidatus Marsarchaeota G2 archaeon ECH_B_SAG-G06]